MDAVVTKEDIERRCTDAITAAVPEGHIRDIMIGCIQQQVKTVVLKTDPRSTIPQMEKVLRTLRPLPPTA